MYCIPILAWMESTAKTTKPRLQHKGVWLSCEQQEEDFGENTIFWHFTCVNCLSRLPYLQGTWDRWPSYP